MHDDMIVLGGGSTVAEYSLRGLETRGKLVAVNESAILTKPNVAITMDRLWAEKRYKLLVTQGVPCILLREGINKNFPILDNTLTFRFTDAYDADVHLKREGKIKRLYSEMSITPGRLNGSNSGTVALNFAFQAKPKRVFLLGFDMCKGPQGQPYWHSPYTWAPDGATKPAKYVEWADEFKDIASQFAVAGIEVFNVTHRSAIEYFKKISYEKFQELT